MLVEPESLCWLTGRMVPARDGATWAQEFARFPALKAVVRDDGSGLGKGLKLERARRRVAQQGDLDDTLDVFHTLREGGRALRTTWAGVTRALDRADAAQKDLDQRGRQGQSRTGYATQTSACGVAPNDSGIRPWPPRRPGSRSSRRSNSSRRRVTSTTATRPKRSLRRRCRT